jgi:DNA primase
MSIFHDVTFATRLNSRLRNFKNKGNNTFNFSCPLCGDSQKSTRKARGYLFPGTKQHGNSLFFKCYNCNESMPFEKFLARVDASLCQEYKLDRYKDGIANSVILTDSEIPKKASSKTLKDKWDFGSIFEKIENLPKEHFAYQYLLKRQIPQDIIKSELYYTADFKHALEQISEKMDLSLSENTISKMRPNDARIMIPFTDMKGNITGFQGRSLDPKNSVRYITIKLDPYAPKVYGLSRLDTTKENIYVFEGPFDSMFIPNSVAVMDADLTNVTVLLPDIIKSKFVLVYDREPRNAAIVHNIEKAIDRKFTVCLFPDSIIGKDINEMILKDNLSPSILMDSIARYSFKGITAKLEFVRWKKVS